MYYSDRDILRVLSETDEVSGRWIIVDPIDDKEKAIQPASIDLRLGDSFAWFASTHTEIDLHNRNIDMNKEKMDSYLLNPGSFVLGTTMERVVLGDKIVAKVEGKSSLGRIGLAIHITAGFIDPGFDGQITLELTNLSPCPIRLRSGVYICQIAFQECFSRAIRPYGTKGLGSLYQSQRDVTPIRKK